MSGGSAAAEGRVAGQVAGQEVACRLEFLSVKAEAEEPGAHGEFRVVGLLRLAAGVSDFLRHVGKGKGKLDEGLELACMDAVLLVALGSVELEKPELDGALGEGCVVIKHTIP